LTAMMRNLKLRPAIGIVLVLCFLVPTLIAGYLALRHQRRFAEQELQNELFRITQILSLGMREPLWTLFPEAGFALVDAYMDDSRIIRITVESEEGVFLTRHGSLKNVGRIISRTMPVTFHGRKLGQVKVEISTLQLETKLAEQTIHYLSIFLVPFILGSVVLFLLLRSKIIRPIERLVRQFNALAQKKLDHAFIWDQSDEIGMLGRRLEQTRQSLHTIVRDIELMHKQEVNHGKELKRINHQLERQIGEKVRAEIALREHKEKLEENIRERTADLVKVNESLRAEMEERRKIEQEQQRIEHKLHRAEKMEAMGMLASGVAHDLNNILAGIVSYPELLLLKLPPEHEIRPILEEIRSAGVRAAAVVADMLTIARGAATVLSPHSVHKLIMEYLESPEFHQLEATFPEMSIVLELRAEHPFILCSPIHIRKCIMNLVANGAEAATDKPLLTIRTQNVTETAGDNLVPRLRLEIIDQGPGIEEKDLEHIFEPFYSTKQMGMSGSGLGLAVVWNAVQNHSGQVMVISSGQGTCFRLTFPSLEMTEEKPEEGDPQLQYNGAGERILVVDDESMLLKITTRMLEHLNYKVSSVSSGEDAVDYLRFHEVDVVILDMIMEPGWNGRQTYEEILKIRPDQKALIISGFAMNDDIRAALGLGVKTFLKKPFTISQLGKAVNLTLQSEDSGDDQN